MPQQQQAEYNSNNIAKQNTVSDYVCVVLYTIAVYYLCVVAAAAAAVAYKTQQVLQNWLATRTAVHTTTAHQPRQCCKHQQTNTASIC
jgi:hypothetical protein